jgi:hypothetical protein
MAKQQQQRTDTRDGKGKPTGQPDDIGDSRGSGGEHAPQSQSTRGTTRDESNSNAQTGDADERREAARERSGGEVSSSQGLAGAQGSGGGAERGMTQHPDPGDPTSGSASDRKV